MPDKGRKVNEVDLYIGARLRLRRNQMGITQEKLADALGVTAQQVQKYENGINRIGACRLFQASQTLNTPVQYFFDGLENLEILPESFNNEALLMDEMSPLIRPEITKLLSAFTQIPSPQIRSHILNLVQALSESKGKM